MVGGKRRRSMLLGPKLLGVRDVDRRCWAPNQWLGVRDIDVHRWASKVLMIYFCQLASSRPLSNLLMIS
jgi:hypothetical protein